MTKNILIWKTIGLEQGNFQKLITENYFYWSNDTKFSSLNKEDLVFIIDINSSTFLYTKFIGNEGLTVENNETNETTTVYDSVSNEILEADGSRWKEFIKFKIIQKIEIKSKEWLQNFKYQSTNGTLYLYKNIPNKKTNSNNFKPSKTIISGEIPNQLLELELIKEASDAIKKSIEYANEFKEKKTTTKPMTDDNFLNQLDDANEIVDHIFENIKNFGFNFKKEEIANFYLSLKTKPFVILAGISGTGKTQLPRLFAEAVGMDRDKQVIQVPVRPDWTDASDLIGYTSLNNQFISKPLTDAILNANKEPDKPFFFILDEMNLARVEHYFADFLSIIETRSHKNGKIITDALITESQIKDANNKDKYQGLYWPENLYLIGTVNMDETTHPFSRKVLDRANSIEMNTVELDWISTNGNKVSALANFTNENLRGNYIGSVDLSKEDKEIVKDELTFLKEINDILKIADLHFAYRVRDEIIFYLLYAKKEDLLEVNQAMDFQLMQKILPRIHGSSIRTQKVLVGLINMFGNESYAENNPDMSHIQKNKLELIKKSDYPKTLEKLIFMIERFDEDRFTSFWV
jgi:hypothetical protein